MTSTVKCLKCGRVLGTRDSNTFYYQTLEIRFDRSGSISCPTASCGHRNPFRVNRDGVKREALQTR